jgi:hypothetical protein
MAEKEENLKVRSQRSYQAKSKNTTQPNAVGIRTDRTYEEPVKSVYSIFI